MSNPQGIRVVDIGAEGPSSLIFSVCAVLLFVLVAVYPMVLAFLYVKATLFAFLVLSAVTKSMATGTYRIDALVCMGTIAVSAVGMVNVVSGLLQRAPGATQEMQVYVIWPLVYLTLLMAIGRQQLGLILRTLEVSILLISVHVALLLIAATSESQLSVLLRLLSAGFQHGVGLHENYVEVRVPGISSLPFLTPLFVGLLVVDRVRSGRRHLALWLFRWLNVAASVMIGILAGRRAYLLVLAATPGVLLLFSLGLPGAMRGKAARGVLVLVVAGASLVAVALVFAHRFLGLSVSGLMTSFFSGFDFGAATGSASIRGRQFTVLMDGFVRQPWFGHGLGSFASEAIRDPSRPWNYELSYVALLFQTGLVGSILYGLAYFVLYFEILRGVMHGDSDSMLFVSLGTGLTGILVANATNPYIGRFDGLWPVFVVLAAINIKRLETNREVHWLTSSGA